MICTAIPVVNPVMTALETKFMIEPNRRSPNSSITTSTTRTKVATFLRSPGSRPAAVSTLRDDSAKALVSVVTINTVLANTEPRTVESVPE